MDFHCHYCEAMRVEYEFKRRHLVTPWLERRMVLTSEHVPPLDAESMEAYLERLWRTVCCV